MTITACQDLVTSNLVASNTSNSVFESGKISFYKVDRTPKCQRRRSDDLAGMLKSTTLSRRLLSTGVILGILIGLSHHFQHASSLGSLRRSLRSVGLQQSTAPEGGYVQHSEKLELTPLNQAGNEFDLEKQKRYNKSNSNKNRISAIDGPNVSIQGETLEQASAQLRKLPAEAG